MRRSITISTWLLTLLAVSTAAQEQRLLLPRSDGNLPDAVPHSGSAVGGSARTPQLMKFSGAFKDPLGRPMTGRHGVTFALYRDQEGGSPIWLETKIVEFDEQGRFTALLGAASERGLTPELFASAEPRWLGVQLQLPGWQEEPRTLMVAVPYALRALDADTLGGRPASAYVLAETSNAASGRSEQSDSPSSATRVPDLPAPLFAQTVNYLQKYTTGTPSLTDSLIFDNGTNIGIGTTNPTFKLSVSSAAVWNNDGSGTFAILDSADGNKKLFAGIDPNLGTYGSAFIQAVRSLTANVPILLNPSGGNVGIGTTSPQHKLQVGSGTIGVSLGLMGNATGGPSLVFEAEDGSDRFAVIADTDPFTWNDRLSVNAIFSPNVLVLTGDGKVGIGTAGPAQKLEVAGNIKLTGTGNGIVFPDGTVQSTAAGSLAFVADELRLLVTKQQQEIKRLQTELLELRTTVELSRAVSPR